MNFMDNDSRFVSEQERIKQQQLLYNEIFISSPRTGPVADIGLDNDYQQRLGLVHLRPETSEYYSGTKLIHDDHFSFYDIRKMVEPGTGFMDIEKAGRILFSSNFANFVKQGSNVMITVNDIFFNNLNVSFLRIEHIRKEVIEASPIKPPYMLDHGLYSIRTANYPPSWGYGGIYWHTHPWNIMVQSYPSREDLEVALQENGKIGIIFVTKTMEWPTAYFMSYFGDHQPQQKEQIRAIFDGILFRVMEFTTANNYTAAIEWNKLKNELREHSFLLDWCVTTDFNEFADKFASILRFKSKIDGGKLLRSNTRG